MPEVTPFEAALAELAKELIAGGAEVAPERTVSVPTQTLGGQRMRGARPMTPQLIDDVPAPRTSNALAGMSDGPLLGTAQNSLGSAAPTELPSRGDAPKQAESVVVLRSKGNDGIVRHHDEGGKFTSNPRKPKVEVSAYDNVMQQARDLSSQKMNLDPVQVALAVALPQLAGRFPRTTATGAGVTTGMYPTAANPQEGQETPEQIMKIQRDMKARGLYDGKIDGVRGGGTNAAVKEFYRIQREESATAAERDKAATGRVTAEAEALKAKAEGEKAAAEAARAKTDADRIASEAAASAQQQTNLEAGNKRFQELENPTDTWGQVQKGLRDLSFPLGWLLGIAGGVKGRGGVERRFTERAQVAADRANALEDRMGAAKGRRMSERAGAVNEFWAEGQQAPLMERMGAQVGNPATPKEVPFAVDAKAPGGFKPNRLAPSAANLYGADTARSALTDAGWMGGAGLDMAIANYKKHAYEADLDQTMKELAKSPNSEALLSQVQSLKNKIAFADFMENLGRGVGSSYGIHSAISGRTHVKPSTTTAESERILLNKYLAGQRERAKSAKQKQP